MNRRLALSFPYLCAALVVALFVWGNHPSNIVARPGESLPGGTRPGESLPGGTRPGESLPGGTRPGESLPGGMPAATEGNHVDPVCRMEVGRTIAEAWSGTDYYFCTKRCRELFNEDPERYLADVCMVCRARNVFTPLEAESQFQATWQKHTYQFCSAAHRDAFRGDPAGYFMHTMWGIPNWLYYSSIAVVLVISFVIFEGRAARDEKDKPKTGHSPKNISLSNPKQKQILHATRPRVDLLNFAPLRRMLLHPATRFASRGLVVTVFVVIILAGLFGSQLPGKNIAPVLTWTVWWGGLVVFVLYTGTAWCYVCPWQAIAEWAEGLRLWGRKKEGLGLGLKWPKFMRNVWPAIVLFVALTWVELGFGVTQNPRATAWLALAMTGLAFASAFVFDRASFCRYGCLVGRIIGLYALFAPVEVRAKDQQRCRSCRTQSCFKGNDSADPCPTFQYLPGMDQNTHCLSCMECLKSCEKENVALQLRPWAEDLAGHYRPRSDEAYLALLMLSLAGFHGLTMTGVWQELVGWLSTATGLGRGLSFSIGMAVLMIAPGLIYASLVALSRHLAREQNLSYRDYFIRYAYALLPIALFYHLAHNSQHLLMEGQRVVALASDPFGWEWDLFRTAGLTLPPLTNLPTLWLAQVFFVLIGHVYSLWVARRVAGTLFGDSTTALRSQIPMLAAMILFSVMSLWLLKQPMDMRTSAM